MKTQLRSAYQASRRRYPAIYTLDRRLRRQSDSRAVSDFLGGKGPLSRHDREALIERIKVADNQLDCAHTQEEILGVMERVLLLNMTKGVVVEAGTYKGGSAAKLSILSKMVGKQLHIFDSFEGIPDNDEKHSTNIFGDDVAFQRGDYAGSLEEVQSAISLYGEVDVCTFHKGFFVETMPSFRLPVSVAYIDVDLASSTRDCIQYLYPLLEPGGALLSQDGHLPLVLEVLNDLDFWKDTVGVDKPEMIGLGSQKLVTILKPDA